MVIIVGQGAAGTTAANELRRLAPAVPITVISDEPDPFYSRIDLPDIIAGKCAAAAATLQASEQFDALRIDCRMGQKVAAVEPGCRQIELASGEKLAYSRLLLATGSSPIIPAVEGAAAIGVHSLWTLSQARTLIKAASSAEAAVVVGAGLIGVKTALALAARGLTVTVVEKLSRVLPRQLDETASAFVAAKIRAKGVAVETGVSVERIEQTSDGCVCGVRITGKTIACDLVVLAVGVRPKTELAALAGLRVRRGIVVDEFMQTSIADIFAAGDAAEVIDRISGLPVVPAIWPEAVEQGLAAARNMAGIKTAYTAGAALNAVEVAGVPIVSVGGIEDEAGDGSILFRKGDCYRKVVMRGKVIRGVLCVGDIRHAGVLANLVQRQAEIRCPDGIACPSFSFADYMAL